MTGRGESYRFLRPHRFSSSVMVEVRSRGFMASNISWATLNISSILVLGCSFIFVRLR